MNILYYRLNTTLSCFLLKLYYGKYIITNKKFIKIKGF